MNKALLEVASTRSRNCSREFDSDSCRHSSKECTKSLFKDKNLLIIAVVIILIACSCGNGIGSFGGFGGGNCCNTGNRCGQKGSSWIWILAILLLFSGTGLGGNGLLSPGNVNTNVIKVNAAEDFEDEFSDCCC